MLFAALVAFLLAYNNVANLVLAFHRWYVQINLLVAGLLLAAARAADVPWAALGLSPEGVGSGLLVGIGAAAVVALAMALAPWLPPVRPLLHDARVRGLPAGEVGKLLAVRIPLGTVVLEEVAFRAVLLAAAFQVTGSTAAAVAVSSVVFGIWHITPTLQALNVNQAAKTPASRVSAVAGAVLLTALAGVALCVLRLVSGSVLAPALVHVCTNGWGSFLAWREQGRAHVAG